MFLALDLYLTLGFAWIILGIPLLILNRRNTLITPVYGIAILMVFGLTLLDNFIKPGMLHPTITQLILSVSRNSYFLIGPALWFYCKTLFNEKINNKQLLLHFVPFILWSILWFIFDRGTVLLPIRNNHPPQFPVNTNLISRAFIRDFLSILSRVIYSLFIILKITKRSKHVKDFYSNLNSKNTLNWLLYIILFYLIIFLSDTILIIKPLKNFMVKNGISTFVRIAPSLIFIFFFTIFSQNQPIPEDKKEKEIEKYKKSGMDISNSEGLFRNLQKILTDKKLFNNPDFNLDLLAEELNETRHRVSEVINRHANENFYSFINRYRLDEFILVIKENRYPNYTILAIAYECGFKSTSAFYNFFKKQMDMTPKEYLTMGKTG